MAAGESLESVKPDDLSAPSKKVREGLADVISMQEMLTNQVPFWDSSNALASVCKTNTCAVLGLQIKQAVDYDNW